MPLFQRHTATWVWLVLMLATIASTWWLSKDAFPPRVGNAAVVLIAAFKVRLVLLHFMELRHAPRPLRLAFEAWTLAVAGMILALS